MPLTPEQRAAFESAVGRATETFRRVRDSSRPHTIPHHSEPTMPQTPASPLSEERVREYEQKPAMHVKQFAEAVASIASEVHCDGGTRIASHKVPSSLCVIVEGSGAILDVVDVEVDRLLGCGCWSGIDIIARRDPTEPDPRDEEIAALTARLEAVERDAARLDWIRDNAERGLTEKADDGTPMLWTFWTPLRKGADWLRDGIDAALSRS